jgi:hypothetical protein
MRSIQFNRSSIQHDHKTEAVRLPKMRDCSTRSAATLSTVSSSVSEYDIEEAVMLTTTTPSQRNDGIVCNTNITFDKTRNSYDEDNDVDSVVSHVSSSYNDNTTAHSHIADNRVRIPPHVNGDSHAENDNDDDISFAPLDDDDDDSSFAPVEDDHNENSFEPQYHRNTDQQECPSDEEGDENEDNENFIHRQLHDPKKEPYSKSQMEESHQRKKDENANSCGIMNDGANRYNEKQFIQQKTLPGLNNSYKVVCVSFMEYDIATSVACKVLDESLRMLRPGGLLYVIDKGGCTVKKHPTMRQWLSRVRDPTVKHLIYEIETRAILQANGFVHRKLDENNDATTVLSDDDDWEDEEIVRWIGIKQ